MGSIERRELKQWDDLHEELAGHPLEAFDFVGWPTSMGWKTLYKLWIRRKTSTGKWWRIESYLAKDEQDPRQKTNDMPFDPIIGGPEVVQSLEPMGGSKALETVFEEIRIRARGEPLFTFKLIRPKEYTADIIMADVLAMAYRNPERFEGLLPAETSILKWGRWDRNGDIDFADPAIDYHLGDMNLHYPPKKARAMLIAAGYLEATPRTAMVDGFEQRVVRFPRAPMAALLARTPGLQAACERQAR